MHRTPGWCSLHINGFNSFIHADELKGLSLEIDNDVHVQHNAPEYDHLFFNARHLYA